MDGGRRGSLRLLMVVQLTQGFRGGIVSPILALFVRRQGLSVAQIGVLDTAGMLGWLLFEPVSGVVADRVRKRYMILFAVVGSTVIYALYPFAGDILHFAVLAFCMSSVMSFYAVSVKALTAELLPVSERGKAYGRYLSVISAGGIIAPFIGGYISATVSYTIPFFISAGIGVFSIAAVLLMRYDGRAVKEDSNVEEESEKEKLWTRPFVSILVVRALFMFNLLFRVHFLPIYLHESPRFGASEAEIGAFMTIVRVMSALSQAFLGDLMDRVGCRAVMASSVGLIGFSYLGLAYLAGIPSLFVLGALQGVLIPAANMSMMIHLMGIMPGGRTGMVMGVYSEAENVGGMVVSPSLGFIYDGLGPSASVFSVSGVLIFTGVLAAFLIREGDGSGKPEK